MTKDWDTLIILDACRYDYLRRQNPFESDVGSITSVGSNSWQFMQGTFVGREMHDTVYVTANPHAERLPDGLFYSVDSLLSDWDEDIGTVRPEPVVDAAIDAHETHPDKRVVVHFMQPHAPHLGPTADRIREEMNIVGWDKDRTNESDGSHEASGLQIWEAAEQGLIDDDQVRQSYSECLDIILKNIQTLLDEIDGKSAVTADHGQLLGEKVVPFGPKMYAHPGYIFSPELRRVPWVEFDSDNRRDVTKGDPREFDRQDDSVVNERLRSLGYVETDEEEQN